MSSMASDTIAAAFASDIDNDHRYRKSSGSPSLDRPESYILIWIQIVCSMLGIMICLYLLIFFFKTEPIIIYHNPDPTAVVLNGAHVYPVTGLIFTMIIAFIMSI